MDDKSERPDDWDGQLRTAIARFVAGETSAYPIRRMIEFRMSRGCGDHSCKIRRPTGQGTNGGCRCWNAVETALFMLEREASSRATPEGL